MILFPSARGFVGGGTSPLSFNVAPLQPPSTTGVIVQAVPYVGGTATISGGINAGLSLDKITWSSSVSATAGQPLYARSDAPAGYNQTVTPTVNLVVPSTFTIGTCSAPNFNFANLVNQPPGQQVSTPSLATNCNGPGTPTGSDTAGLGVSFTPTPVPAGGSFSVTGTAPPGWNATNTVTVNFNGFTDTFAITTPQQPTFSWIGSQTANKAHNSGYATSTLKINNILGPYLFSGTGAGSPQVSRDGSTWSTSLTLGPSDSGVTLYVAVLAPAQIFQKNTANFSVNYGTASVALGSFAVTANS